MSNMILVKLVDIQCFNVFSHLVVACSSGALSALYVKLLSSVVLITPVNVMKCWILKFTL